MEIPIAPLSPSPAPVTPLCFLLLSTGPRMCWNPSYLSKALPLIAHLPPDTAPFSAPLSIQLLKELLILVSFTPVPFHPYHSTEIILLSIISGLVATISRAQPSSYLTHQQRLSQSTNSSSSLRLIFHGRKHWLSSYPSACSFSASLLMSLLSFFFFLFVFGCPKAHGVPWPGIRSEPQL